MPRHSRLRRYRDQGRTASFDRRRACGMRSPGPAATRCDPPDRSRRPIAAGPEPARAQRAIAVECARRLGPLGDAPSFDALESVETRVIAVTRIIQLVRVAIAVADANEPPLARVAAS